MEQPGMGVGRWLGNSVSEVLVTAGRRLVISHNVCGHSVAHILAGLR